MNQKYFNEIGIATTIDSWLLLPEYHLYEQNVKDFEGFNIYS